MLEQFVYGQDMKLPPDQDPKEAVRKIIGDQSDPRFKYSVDSIIATLPDPIESGLSDKLEDDIDAIQRAAESQGYVLDRFKLPWPTPGERAAKGDEAQIDQSEDSGPATGETAQRGAKRAQRSEPGVLLFRDGHTRRALVVSRWRDSHLWNSQASAAQGSPAGVRAAQRVRFRSPARRL